MQPIQQRNDELDLGQIILTLIRRWPWVLGGAAIGLIAALIFNERSKPVWKGEFQIVLAKKERVGGGLGALAAANPMLAQLAGIGGGGGGSELDTEVKILESPLVLRPVFEFVSASKPDNKKSGQKLLFSAWVKSSLKVKLAKGTSILNISYLDRDRDLVLPVLQRISAAYQSYSGRDRSESLSRGLSYVTQQVARLRKETEASNRALDAFSIRYGIASSGGSISSAGLDISRLLSSSNGRSQDAGAMVNTGGSTTRSSTISSQGDALGQLAAINQELIRRQQQFTERDPAIQALQRERVAMRRYIETTAGGNLALPGQQPLSKEQAQEIMLKFQELDRTAKRNTATLDSLESTMLSLELEEARATRPWELISNPTLLEAPVSPQRSRNLALGLLAGLLVGSGAALSIDRRSGLVFNLDELQSLLPYPPLSNLPATDTNSWMVSMMLLAEGPLNGAVQVALIPTGAIAQAQLIADQLLQALQRSDPAAQVLLTTDLSVARQCNVQLLLGAPGSARREDLQRLNQNLQLQGKPVAGLLIIDHAA